MSIYKIPDSDTLFVYKDKKIIGKIENQDIRRLTYQDICNSPSVWFLINKHDEYLYFSYKQNILIEIQEMNNDLISYILDY
jgi:hypothetical protein